MLSRIPLKKVPSINFATIGDAPLSSPPSHRPARYGINQFSDLSPPEFRSRYLTLHIPKKLHASKVHPFKSEMLSPQAIMSVSSPFERSLNEQGRPKAPVVEMDGRMDKRSLRH